MLVPVEVQGVLQKIDSASLLVKRKGKWVEYDRAAPYNPPKRKAHSPLIVDAKAHFRKGIRELWAYLQYLGDTHDPPSRKSPLIYTGRPDSKRSKH